MIFLVCSCCMIVLFYLFFQARWLFCIEQLDLFQVFFFSDFLFKKNLLSLAIGINSFALLASNLKP